MRVELTMRSGRDVCKVFRASAVATEVATPLGEDVWGVEGVRDLRLWCGFAGAQGCGLARGVAGAQALSSAVNGCLRARGWNLG
jgi:hypothetical protein